MGVNQNKIAVLCNYELLPERVGGMDYFFWLFNQRCKENSIHVDWFFPNTATHGGYKKLKITSCNEENIEHFFTNKVVNSDSNYSHIITHFIEVGTPIFKKMKLTTKAEIIVVDHNPRPIAGYKLLKKIKKRIKGILYLRYIDLLISVSNYSKNQLIKEFGARVNQKNKIIYNGLEISKFIKKTDFTFKGKFIVACHLRKDKGVQDLILAVRNLKKETPINFTVDIYGNGYYKDTLKKLVHDFSLDTVFIFKGNSANLNEIYWKYDYLIHPSHGETFCFSVVESLLCNLPVITNNHGNVLQLITENSNGFLYEEERIDQLETILKKVINNEMAIENGLIKEPKVIDLSLDNMVINYLNLLK